MLAHRFALAGVVLAAALVCGEPQLREETDGSEIIPSQRSALVALYHATNGPTWRNNQWPHELKGNACTWPGVVCDQGHVVQLQLEHSLNGGTLPKELGQLTSMIVLDAGSNLCSGTLPAELSAMTRLQQMELDGNHFEGGIPDAWQSFLDASVHGPPRGGGECRASLSVTVVTRKPVEPPSCTRARVA
jgi:hypothetical protein